MTVTATPTPTPTPETPKSARAIADLLEDSIAKVEKVVTITEDNDPNDSIGRPNGYVSAAVLYDSRVQCSDGLGADCGATVEEWKTVKAAGKRADYIQSILEDAPILGAEYDTVGGTFLLRVAGDLKPSEAKQYQEAFSALF